METRPDFSQLLKPASAAESRRRARGRTEALGAALAAAVAVGALGWTSRPQTASAAPAAFTENLARVADMPAAPRASGISALAGRAAASPRALWPATDEPSPALVAALLSVQDSNARALGGSAGASALAPAAAALGGSSGFGGSAPGVSAAQAGLSLPDDSQ